MNERHYFDLWTPGEFLSAMRSKIRQAYPTAEAFVYNSICGEHGGSDSIAWEDSATREHKSLSARNRVELMLKVRRMVENAMMGVAKRSEENDGKKLAS